MSKKEDSCLLLYDGDCRVCRVLALKALKYSKSVIRPVPLKSLEASHLLKTFYPSGWQRNFYVVSPSTRGLRCEGGLRAVRYLLKLLGPLNFMKLLTSYSWFNMHAKLFPGDLVLPRRPCCGGKSIDVGRRRFIGSLLKSALAMAALYFFTSGDERVAYASTNPQSIQRDETGRITPPPDWERYDVEEVVLERLRIAFEARGLWPGRVLGFGYHGKGKYHILFPGPEDAEALEIARRIVKGELEVYTDAKCEPVACYYHRPIIGGICVTKKVSDNPLVCKLATIGYVATRPSNGTEGIVTAGHLTDGLTGDPLYQTNCGLDEDKIATVELATNDLYMDALYARFTPSNTSREPRIYDLGWVTSWTGYDSVPVGLVVSWRGITSGRVNTQVKSKGYYCDKQRQILLYPPLLQGGDSGATCAWQTQSGNWSLVGILHSWVKIGGMPYGNCCSAIDTVIDRWGVYPKLYSG